MTDGDWPAVVEKDLPVSTLLLDVLAGPAAVVPVAPLPLEVDAATDDCGWLGPATVADVDALLGQELILVPMLPLGAVNPVVVAVTGTDDALIPGAAAVVVVATGGWPAEPAATLVEPLINPPLDS